MSEIFTQKELDSLCDLTENHKIFLVENKDFNQASQLIEEILLKEHEGYRGYNKIVFNNCSFTDLQIKNRTFKTPFEFKNCTLYGHTLFDKCIFDCDFSFEGSQIKSTAEFMDCRFYKKGIFDKIVTYKQKGIPYEGVFTIRGILNDSDYRSGVSLSFKEAVFNSYVYILYLKNIRFDFMDAVFNWRFAFSGVLFKSGSLFLNTRFEGISHNLPIHYQIVALSELGCCFKESNMDLEAKMIDEEKKKCYALSAKEGTIWKPYSEGPRPFSLNRHRETEILLTEEEMCKIAGIGLASFRKRKTLAKKNKTIKIPTPYNPGHKPLQYTKKEARKFHTILVEEDRNKRKDANNN